MAGHYIVLLNHLWIGPIPSEIDGIKVQFLQESTEALLDLGERFVDGEVFAQIRFALVS